jgi:hypothetical protein
MYTQANPPAPEGNQVAFMQMSCSILQTVRFTAGTYRISFQAAQRAELQVPDTKTKQYQSGRQTIQVQVDNRVVGKITPESTSYKIYNTDSFPVGAGAHTIKFVGLNPNGGDNTAFIDQVSIEAVGTGAATQRSTTAR